MASPAFTRYWGCICAEGAQPPTILGGALVQCPAPGASVTRWIVAVIVLAVVLGLVLGLVLFCILWWVAGGGQRMMGNH